MGAAYFYHLTQTPLEQTLPTLLEKCRGAGWRVAVRGTDTARLDWLDEKLWLIGDGSFLPHGRAGGAHDGAQPILLTDQADAPNTPACVMCIDGADVSDAEVVALERVCILFDGNDEAAVAKARKQWKSLTGAGCSAQYWSQETGRWEKKAES